MKNLVILVACLSAFAQTAIAASSTPIKYECVLVADFDDWSLNFDNRRVGFFDNDHWSALTFTGTKNGWYTYKGVDTFLGGNFALFAVIKPYQKDPRFAQAFLMTQGRKFKMSCQYNPKPWIRNPHR